MSRLIARSLLLTALVAVPAAAQDTDWQWFQASGLAKVGDTVHVTDITGRRVTGRIQELSPSSVVLLSDVTPRTFAAADVIRIQRSDTVANGLLIGLAAGLAGAYIARNSLCGRSDSECEVIVNVAVGLPMVVGGTVLGGVTDMLIKKSIYTAPRSMRIGFSPIVWRDRRGAALTLAF